MKTIQWQDSYLLGNQLIDSEHQIFASLINKLIVAVTNRKSITHLERLVLEIQKYAEFHFVSEENYMMEVGYDNLKEHQKQHALLIEEFSRSQNYIELGEKGYADFGVFLVDWFQSHTVNQDQLIVNFVNNSANKK